MTFTTTDRLKRDMQQNLFVYGTPAPQEQQA